MQENALFFLLESPFFFLKFTPGLRIMNSSLFLDEECLNKSP